MNDDETATGTGEERRAAGTPFFYNELLLEGGHGVPLPIVVNSKRGFQAVVRDLLVRARVEEVSIEPTATTLGAMLFGCQEFIAGSQDLLDAGSPADVRAASSRMLRACREFSGSLESAYAILQATEGASESGVAFAALPCARLKNLGAAIEAFFENTELTVTMDLGRLAILEVRLDDLFDECSRQLERFYSCALNRSRPELFLEFARCFYRDLFRRILPDHIFDPVKNQPAGGTERSGLLDLLPELADSVREPQ